MNAGAGRRFYDNQGSESIESSRGCKLKEDRRGGRHQPCQRTRGGPLFHPRFPKGGPWLEDECKEIYVWVAAREGESTRDFGNSRVREKSRLWGGDKEIFIPLRPFKLLFRGWTKLGEYLTPLFLESSFNSGVKNLFINNSLLTRFKTVAHFSFSIFPLSQKFEFSSTRQLPW